MSYKKHFSTCLIIKFKQLHSISERQRFCHTDPQEIWFLSNQSSSQFLQVGNFFHFYFLGFFENPG